jgi:flagellar motility protein MotE (MotC chaperone)
MAHIPTPRLLPLTIFALSGLLGVKSVTLVRAAVESPAPSTSTGAAQAAPTTPAAAAATPMATVPTPATAAAPPMTATPSGTPTLPPVTQPAISSAASSRPSLAGPPQSMPSGPPPVSAVGDSERAVLLELRHRREELDARDAMVAAREATLAAAQLRLTARVAELEALQHKLETLEQARQQRDDTSWQGLVKLYENMRPRDAATIFNELDMQVLLGVVDRMKDAKAAPVLAAMQPDKARELTTKLAAARTRRAAVAEKN